MQEYILYNFLPTYLMEAGAAIAGIWYLKRNPNSPPEIKILVGYLWLVVFVELLGLYPAIAYLTDYQYFSYTKGTPLERNYWLYNSFTLFTIFTYSVYFIAQLESLNNRFIFRLLLVFFLLAATINLIFIEGLFLSYSGFNSILGTLIIVLLILFYYYELLNNNKLLEFYKNLAFYISVGVLIWFLVVTPIFIYSTYFSLINPEFVSLQSLVLKICNLFLYGIIITGFYMCSGKRNLLQKPE